MGYQNGRLPASALSRIPGRGRLRKPAAYAYSAMAARARRDGVNLSIYDGSISRSYRTLAQQYRAKQIYGSNAATPGTSNHGLGLAVDLHNWTQRNWIDRRGAAYGWAKKWSDASWEFWHLRWRGGIYKGAAPFRPLRYGSMGARVKRVQRELRRRGFQSVPVKGRTHGYYGRSTVSAVKRVQKAHGLSPDGVVGRRTWGLLFN